MPKVNLFQILNVINMAMSVVQAIAKGKSKQEKIDTAIDLAAPLVAGLEATFGQDFLKEEKIKPLVEKYITAAKDLVNGIQEFKDLKN